MTDQQCALMTQAISDIANQVAQLKVEIQSIKVTLVNIAQKMNQPEIRS